MQRTIYRIHKTGRDTRYSIRTKGLKTTLYTVKKRFASFPSPAGMSLPNSPWAGNDVITELFLPRGSLVSDIPAGDGKLVNLFLRCTGYRFRITVYKIQDTEYHRQDTVYRIQGK
jgi:hypothetical protein